MSLTTCIRKAGDALRAEDKAEILAAAAKYRKAGMGADEAGRKAVDDQIAAVQAMLEAPAEMAAPAPEPAAPAVVEDFGEKLPPARRAMAAKLDEDLSDDDIAKRPLSEIWPLAENEAIEDTFAAAVAHAARAEVPAKPRQPYKLRQWVAKVKTVRELAGKIVSGRVTRERMIELVNTQQRGLKDWLAKVLLLEQVPRDQWKRIGAVEERPESFTYQDGKQVSTPMLRLEIDGKAQWLRGDAGVQGDERGTVAGNKAAIMALLAAAEPDKRMEFEIRGPSGGPFKINKKGDPEYRPLMKFATPEEARRAINVDYDSLVAAWEAVKSRDNITERDLRSAENRPRVGKDHRGGKDVSAEQFQDTFGFRGGEFGKWVQQGKGDKERQALLNSAYDALMDLSDIVGVPPKAISLNGTLGIAFGSRGSGWASAHFEPSNLVINLTKTRGAGSLAHEWLHALDNYFGRMRRGGEESKFTGDKKQYDAENFITHKPERLMVRKDSSRWTLTAGKLEAYREANPTSPQYAAEHWMPDPKHPDGVRPEVERAFADLVAELNASPMAKRAQKLDKGKSDGYWSSTLEMAARAFESFVMARMHESGYHNDFLVNVRKAEEVAKDPARYPYLMAGEIKPIADAFEALFSTVKTREDDAGNVAMFSRASTGRGITMTDARAVAGNIRAALPKAPPIILHESVDKAPRKLRDAIAAEGAERDVEAAYHEGEIHVFPAHIESIERMEFVVGRHEIRHYGIRAMLGPRYGQTLLAMVQKNPALREAARKKIDDGLARSMVEAADEALADMPVEQIAKLNGFDRFVAAIRQWLRDMAAKLRRGGMPRLADAIDPKEWTDRDVAAFVLKAEDMSRKGSPEPMSTGGTMFGRAWHGSPYRGIDKFTTDAIGTGEGAQAYGWGLYFAGKKEIADYYRKKLAGDGSRTFTKDDKTLESTADLMEAYYKPGRIVRGYGGADKVQEFQRTPNFGWAVKVVGVKANGEPMSSERPRWHSTQPDAATLKMALEDDGWKASAPGQLYEVSIPEDNEMLLWDAPISAQPKNVQDALQRVLATADDSTKQTWADYSTDWKKGGKMAYSILSTSETDNLGGEDGERTSKALLAAGIKGIKYLDGSSRTAGEGSYNYVIFSGDDVAIERTMFSRAAQTNTDAFRRWFRDSKVVNSDGNPRAVYHGTGADITAFDRSRAGETSRASNTKLGFFFTTRPDVANTYARMAQGSPNVMQAYLSIQNPLRITAKNMAEADKMLERELGAEHDGAIITVAPETGPGQTVFMARNPEQIKSATGNRGTFDPASADIRYSRNLASQDLVNARGGVFDFNRLGETKQDRIRTVIDGARPFWLGALTRDQIADVFGDEIPPVRDYDQLTRSMENERQKMAQDADKLYNEWTKLPEAANDRLARIMLDATVNSVHPDKDAGLPKKATPEQRAVHARIRVEFKALPPEAQAMYGKVKAFHENTLAQLRAAIEGRLERQVENGAVRQATLTNIRKMFDKYLENGPYFPLSRFGDFLVIGTRGDGERVVAAYENAGEQQAAARALQKDGFTVKMKTAKTYSREQDGSAGQFIGDVMMALEKVDMVEATVNGTRTDLKNQLLDDINQLFIKSLPDLSYRKHFMHRKNTPGFSADVMRGFAASAFHSASHIARVNHGDRMTFSLRDAYQAIELAPEGDFNKHMQVLNELTKRHDASLNPNTHPIAAVLNQIGFVMYLGLSPAAGLVNLLQTPMVTLPHLGARYGFRKASASMGKATSDIMAAPVNKQSGWDATASDKLTAAEKAAMRELQDEGIIDLTQAHDLASASGLDTGNVARSKAAFAMARAMKIVGWTFHVPEVMNRQVTALSAYRLEMERSGDAAKAKEAAREAIRRTHFDYSSSNRARYMQGNIARVALQFKQYAQNMTYLLGRAAQQALSGETPEVRRIARRQLVATLGATFGMAGALGLPGLGAAMGLIGMMVEGLDDDDEPWDWKVEFRNLMADTFGKEAGEVIAHGLPRALMPWDIAGRVGMGELWWRSSDREGQNPREAFATDIGNILGPTAGTMLGWYTASDHMARGEYSKAAEAVVPKFIRDPLKALRESQEGVTSYMGEPLKDTTVAEELGRLLGFAPASVSEMYEGRGAVMNAKTALEEKRQRLLSQVAKARIDRDTERERDLREKIAEFNRRNPEYRITGSSIVKSVMARRRNRANTEDGIMLPDTKDFLRERARFAVTQ